MNEQHPIVAWAAESEKNRRFLAMTAMILVAFFWAVVETLGHFIPRGYSPLQTVWSRYLVHMLFMIAAFGPRKGTELIKTKCLKMQIMRGFLMIGMPFCYAFGVSILPVHDVWAVSWTSSIMLIFMAIWILKERVSFTLWFVSLLAWLGVWIMLGAEVPALGWGLLAPLGMGLCYALYKTMTRMMRAESSYANLFHTALWVFCPLTLLVPFSWKTPTAPLVGIYVGIGFFGYLALLFLDKSMELAPAALTAPLIYTQPIWVDLFDYLVHGHKPGLAPVIGATIILVAAVYLFTVEMTGMRQLVRAD